MYWVLLGRAIALWRSVLLSIDCSSSFSSSYKETSSISSSESLSSSSSPVARSLKTKIVELTFRDSVGSRDGKLSKAESDDCCDYSKIEFSSTTASNLGMCLLSILDLGVCLNSIKKSWNAFEDPDVRSMTLRFSQNKTTVHADIAK